MKIRIIEGQIIEVLLYSAFVIVVVELMKSEKKVQELVVENIIILIFVVADSLSEIETTKMGNTRAETISKLC